MQCIRVSFSSKHQFGNTALYVAARKDKSRCVRALLSHPGIDINIKNNHGSTAMMVAGYKSLGVFNEMIKTCNDFPADSYGKVVLCGNSGAGKSTLTQVGFIIHGWQAKISGVVVLSY